MFESEEQIRKINWKCRWCCQKKTLSEDVDVVKNSQKENDFFKKKTTIEENVVDDAKNSQKENVDDDVKKNGIQGRKKT